jgi:23S rRNA (uracil1939-C5)-methyltransferase
MTETRSGRRKAPKPPVPAEVRLLEWGPRGMTRTDWNNRSLLVDRGIPGEMVVAAVDMQRRPRRGLAVEVLDASPERVVPPCPFYLQGCGGCQWQHLDYGAQVAVKRLGVDREMERVGVAARVERVHAMENPWRYRRTAALALGWEAGFRPRGRRGIVQIDDCLIAHPAIGALAATMNDLLQAGSVPNYHGKVWLDCTVVGSSQAPALQVLIQGIPGLTLETHPELPEVAQRIAALHGVSTVAFRHRTGEARPLIGELMSTVDVQGRPMWLPAGSFFQTNLDMLSLLIDRMREELGGGHIGRLADIYGGVGTFGLQLAGEVGEVTLVELDPAAVAAARRTAGDWGLDNLTFVDRHAEQVLPDLPPLDAVVVDPPRSGLGRVITDAIGRNGVPLVFYVSCSPVSLADDLAAFHEEGFRIKSLEMFDFYPQTYHVESFAILER